MVLQNPALVGTSVAPCCDREGTAVISIVFHCIPAGFYE